MRFSNDMEIDLRRAGTRRSYRKTLCAWMLVPLAVGGCASFAGFGMSADQVAATWVGRSFTELESQWRVSWFRSKDDATGQDALSAMFGQEEGYVADDYTYTAATGQNEYTQYTEENDVYVPRQVHCNISFYAEPQTQRIVRYQIAGDRCDRYARSWGPAR